MQPFFIYFENFRKNTFVPLLSFHRHVMLIFLLSMKQGIVSKAIIEPLAMPASPAINAESSIIIKINMFFTTNCTRPCPRSLSTFEALLKSRLITNRYNSIKIKKSNLCGVKMIANEIEMIKKMR